MTSFAIDKSNLTYDEAIEEVKKNYPENESRKNYLIKQAIDAAKNKPKTSKVEIKVYLNDFSGNYKIQIDEDFFDAVLPNYQTFLIVLNKKNKRNTDSEATSEFFFE